MAKTTVQKSSGTGKKKYIKWGLISLNVFIILGLMASTVYFYRQYNVKSDELAMTEDQRNEKRIAEVGKVYSLPKDEKPVLALVADEEKFKTEYKVFTDAKKDDWLLLYEKAGTAILYRPSEKKVIATAPLSIQKKLGIALIGDDSSLSEVEAKLSAEVGDDVNIVGKSAGVTIYPNTIVVDVSGQQGTAAQQIATLLGGTVGNLPAGETAPEGSDLVVIVSLPAPTQ